MAKFIFHVRSPRQRDAVVIEESHAAAKHRAFFCDPHGGWEHGAVDILARVRESMTVRVVAIERMSKKTTAFIESLEDAEEEFQSLEPEAARQYAVTLHEQLTELTDRWRPR